MKHSPLSLAIASAQADAMVAITRRVIATHDLTGLVLGARHGHREIGQIVSTLARGARADRALSAYGLAADRILPSTIESTPEVATTG